MSRSETPRSSKKTRRGGEPWYAEGIRFACQKCGQCCRGEPGVVWVNREEVARMSEYLGVSDHEFRRRYLRRVGFRLSLKELDNGDCVLYRDGCMVYPVRPRQCRTFPFWPEALRSRGWFDQFVRNCPGVGKGRLYSREEIEEVSRGEATTGTIGEEK